MTIDTSREAVEQINEELSWDNSFGAIELINALLARAEAAEAECVKMLNEQDRDYNRKTNDLIERHADQITFLLAERDAALAKRDAALAKRDAALAEVTRLSTPPDDVEVGELVAELGEPLVIIEGYSTDYVDTDDVRERMGKAADALTRLSHALAAETAKREAMEAALEPFADESLHVGPEHTFVAVPVAACDAARATLAKHGSKT